MEPWNSSLDGTSDENLVVDKSTVYLKTIPDHASAELVENAEGRLSSARPKVETEPILAGDPSGVPYPPLHVCYNFMILIAESPSRRTEYRRYLGNAGLY